MQWCKNRLVMPQLCGVAATFRLHYLRRLKPATTNSPYVTEGLFVFLHCLMISLK